MAKKVFIDGEAGTTGIDVRKRLQGRVDLEVLSVDRDKRKDLDERQRLLNQADVVILCLPDDAARESVSLIENDSTKVIDASTAHRVAPGWTYGFPEMSKEQTFAVASSKRVANPGCWPQGAIATLRPLIEAGLVPASQLCSVHGISGYSGGGRTMIEDYEAKGEDALEYLPYGLNFHHKHLPELQQYAKLSRRPVFVPAVGKFRNGMIVTVPLQLGDVGAVSTGKLLHQCLADHYAGIPDGFVEVAPLIELERTSEMNPERYNGTNRMCLHVLASDQYRQAILFAVYDNLGKGASGAAVQNLNLMLGLPGNFGFA